MNELCMSTDVPGELMDFYEALYERSLQKNLPQVCVLCKFDF